MLRALRLAVTIAVLPLMLVLSATPVLIAYALEKESVVGQGPPIDLEALVASKALMKRVLWQIESADDTRSTTLVVTEGELKHLAQMGSHPFASLNADLDFAGTSMIPRVSLQLIPNPIGEYLNLVFQINQSNSGLSVDRLSIGPLELPARWLLPSIAYLADTVLQDRQASLLLASVQGFRIEGNSALFSVQPPPELKAQLKQAVKTLQATRFPPGEQERVLHYYELLSRIGARGRRSSLSFSDFLTPLMKEAFRRQEPGSALAENRAVIYALAVYFSRGALEPLMGDLISSQRTLVRPPSGVSLANRWDLMAHFVYSAGITLATQQGIGIAAGEIKELLDSGGGSGFSFADLAADRAGIRFVAVAMSSELAARQFQQSIVANPGERAFFPDINGLQEGLNDAQFRQQYGDIHSERYRLEVALIDQRIERLAVYQGYTSYQ
jgi:hypothetical protein